MKKLLLVSALMTMLFLSNAQQDSVLKSKKGKIILPEKHDIGIGISGNSFLNFVGNFFNQSGKNQMNLNMILDNQFYAKYFLDSKNVIRLRGNYYTVSQNYENSIPDDLDFSGTKSVVDKLSKNYYRLNFALGYERRHTNGRFQWSTGAELTVNQNYSNAIYTYGNAMSAINTNPNSTNFDYAPNTIMMGRNSSRIISSKYDSGLSYGARAFLGIEYFIFPKISVGGEFGIYGNLKSNPKNISTVETWDFMYQKKNERSTELNGKEQNSAIDNLSGQIVLTFYFH